MAYQPHTIHSNPDRHPASFQDAPKVQELPASKKKVAMILLTGLGICFAVFALVIGLLIQILVVHQYYLSSGSLVTTAPLGRTLAIAHACSIVVTATVPVVMGLEAFRLSRHWLVASNTRGENRPTPFQLGILMSVLHGAHLSSLWRGFSYLLGVGDTAQAPVRRPPILRRAIFTSITFLAIAYLCAGLETWLSVSSDAILFPQVKEYTAYPPPTSRVLNKTLCAGDTEYYVCGLAAGGTQAFLASLPEGLRTLTNTSDTNAVAFAEDQTAMIVPSANLIELNTEYLAKAYGVRASCQSITSQCVSPNTFSPEAFLNINCPSSAVFNASMISETTGEYYPNGVLDAKGNVLVEPWQLVSNVFSPFRYGAVIISNAYLVEDDTFTGDTGFFSHGNQGAYNVLTCNVTALDVVYKYTNGSYTLTSAVPSDLNQTRSIATMTATSNFLDRVPLAAEGAGLEPGSMPYTEAFSLELAREMMAFSASIYEPGEPLGINYLLPTIGARLQLGPLVLLLAMLGSYCTMVFIISILSAISSSLTPYASLARNRLTDPLTTVYFAFGPVLPEKTWEDSSTKLFAVETEADRLNVGPMYLGDGSAVFGVSRSAPV